MDGWVHERKKRKMKENMEEVKGSRIEKRMEQGILLQRKRQEGKEGEREIEK